MEYSLDPVSLINRGLAKYDPNADACLRRGPPLTKLPGICYSEPVIRNIQSVGHYNFSQAPSRQRGSCTKPQLAKMPDRMATEYYPIPATVNTAIEPFGRVGTDTRWLSKSRC